MKFYQYLPTFLAYLYLFSLSAYGEHLGEFTLQEVTPYMTTYDQFDSSYKLKKGSFKVFYRWCEDRFNCTLYNEGEFTISNRKYYKRNGGAAGKGLYVADSIHSSRTFGNDCMEIIVPKSKVGRMNNFYNFNNNGWFICKRKNDVYFRPFYGHDYADHEIISDKSEKVRHAVQKRKQDFLWIYFENRLGCFHDFNGRKNPFHKIIDNNNQKKWFFIKRKKLIKDRITISMNGKIFDEIPYELCPPRANLNLFNYQLYTEKYQ